jgi:hypothetical protein
MAHPVTPVDDPSAPPPSTVLVDPDRTALDVLKEVHNRGAELYNLQRPSECLAMYDGALRVVRPFLAHRPAIQKTITDGLAEVTKTAGAKLQAFRLHEIIEEVRVALKLEVRKAETGRPSIDPITSTPASPVVAGPPSAKELIDAVRTGLVGGLVRLDGVPVGGAEVSAVSLTLPETRTAVTATRADGTFLFPTVLPTGEYVLRVTGPAIPVWYQEFATSKLRMTVGRGQADVVLELTR